MIAFRALGQSDQESHVEADRDHPAWPVTGGLAATLAEPIDVMTAFGLVCPVLDVLLGDWLAMELLHLTSVVRI